MVIIMIMNESQLNYIVRNYGSVERFELITNQRRNGELESDDDSIFNDGYCCHEMAPSNSGSKSERQSMDDIVNESTSDVFVDNVESTDYFPGNASKPTSVALNAKYQLARTYRKFIKPAFAIGESSGDVLDVVGNYERPTNVDDDCGCRTAPRAMTPMAWKSRFLAADSVRARSARSSIVRIDNRRCRGTGGRVSGHFGRIKSLACINAWDPI